MAVNRNQPNWGGARPGSGRPRKPEAEKRVVKGVSLSPEAWTKLEKARGGLSRSSFLNHLILSL